MQKWIQDKFSEILGYEYDSDIAAYVAAMETEKELIEHMKEIPTLNDSKRRQIITDWKKMRASLSGSGSSCGKKFNDGNNHKSKKSKSKEKENIVVQEMPKPVDQAEKKKTKFVNLYSQEGKDRQIVLLKGRSKCDCEARIHALINNCLHCGRIVCEQERSGPCLFCGAMVCTPEQQAVLASKSKQSDTLYNKLMDQKPAKVTEDALKHRDKLLDYDKNSARRTEVIDDECDYYQSTNSVWLSSSEREKMQKRETEMNDKKYESRLTRKVTLDFAGREVVEEPQEDIHDVLNKEFRESAESMISRIPHDSYICPTIDFDRPCYVDMKNINAKKSKGKSKIGDIASCHSRIQDKEYLEMVDEGVCLSLHQPYASFLVAGIKTHEGRGWYSSHRGRLWIAAASAGPNAMTISMLEDRYRARLGEDVKFPPSYPTGCLLGCVTVTDVLPSNEYRRVYPKGDVDNPFVFICDDCYELPLKFPIVGKHKIYKLEKQIHQAAMKCLEQSLKRAS